MTKMHNRRKNDGCAFYTRNNCIVKTHRKMYNKYKVLNNQMYMYFVSEFEEDYYV